jgi:hypothetical protein
MRSINRRLAKLEERCGLGPETEEERRSRERLADLKRRFAAAGASYGRPPEDPDALKPEDVAGLILVQILNLRFSRSRPTQPKGALPKEKILAFLTSDNAPHRSRS